MQAPINRNKIIGKKDWIKGLILVIAWMLIFSLARDLWQVKSGFSRIDQAKVGLSEAINQNETLKEKLALVSTDAYKEKIIREQLNMQKVGEVVAVLPKTGLKPAGTAEAVEEASENWEKWWALLK